MASMIRGEKHGEEGHEIERMRSIESVAHFEAQKRLDAFDKLGWQRDGRASEPAENREASFARGK